MIGRADAGPEGTHTNASAAQGRHIPFRGLDSQTNIAITQRHLPHWTQPEATYFVTFRLADSVPLDLQKQWQAERAVWMRLHPEPWSPDAEAEYQQRFTRQQDEWLDAGMGACHLRRGHIRREVEASLTRFDGQRLDLDAYVTMPNHVHALITPRSGQSLFELLKGIKGSSARNCNEALGRSKEPFWMADSYNRIVRNAEELFATRRYIENNPANTRPRSDEFTLVMNNILVPDL